MRIAVLGASGYVGGRLVARLLEAGHDLTLIARDPDALAERFPSAAVVRGDVLEPGSLGPWLRGVEVAYYLVHAIGQGEADAPDRDLRGARNMAEAAATARVRRIIYLGALGDAVRAVSPHLARRQAVGAELARTGVPVTELRAGIIIGSGGASFEILRHLTERLPVMVTPRWVDARCQPIGIRDVLDYLIEALELPEACGVVEIGGQDVLSYREMMLGYARIRGLRRLMIPVPLLTPRLSSYWLSLVSPIPAGVARPFVEALRGDLLVRDPGPARRFSVRPMGYEDAVRRALDRTARSDVESTWFDAYASSRHGRSAALLESREGMFIDRRSRGIDAPPGRVFAEVERLGGRSGWPFANGLWRLRGLMDRLVGGIGMRLGRRDPVRLRPGDALDFWRVEAIQRPELLRLRAVMRTPGRAWLQYEVEETPTGSNLVQTAFFEPRGLGGLAYWYALLPVHAVVFRGMVAALAERAVEPPSQPASAGDRPD